MSNVQQWSWKIAQMAPAGERIHHFRSIGNERNQQKIFHSGNMVFIVKFSYGQCVDLQTRKRRNNESLLGIEGSIEEQLRAEGII